MYYDIKGMEESMKKTIGIIVMIFICMSISFGEDSITIYVPENEVFIGETKMEINRGEYPLMYHKHMPYLPLSYDVLGYVGLESSFNENGLNLKTCYQNESYLQVFKGDYKKPGVKNDVQSPYFDISLNDIPLIKNSEYPLFLYKGVLYIPMIEEYKALLNITGEWRRDGSYQVQNNFVQKPATLREEPVKSLEALLSLSNAIVDIKVIKSSGNVTGQGFFISENKIMTNYHLIDEALSITTDYNNQTLDVVKVVDYDAANNMAILEVEGVSKTYIRIGNSENMNVEGSVFRLDKSQMKQETIGSFVDNTIRLKSNLTSGILINEYGEAIGMSDSGIKGQISPVIKAFNSKTHLDQILNLSLEAFYDITSKPVTPGWVKIEYVDDYDVKVTWENTGADNYKINITEDYGYGSKLYDLKDEKGRFISNVDGSEGVLIEDLKSHYLYQIRVVPYKNGLEGKASYREEFYSKKLGDNKLEFELFEKYQYIRSENYSFEINDFDVFRSQMSDRVIIDIKLDKENINQARKMAKYNNETFEEIIKEIDLYTMKAARFQVYFRMYYEDVYTNQTYKDGTSVETQMHGSKIIHVKVVESVLNDVFNYNYWYE